MWVVFAAAALVVAGLVAPLAAKDYEARDLRGTYHFVVTEAGPEVEYCDSYATITFDGVVGCRKKGADRQKAIRP